MYPATETCEEGEHCIESLGDSLSPHQQSNKPNAQFAVKTSLSAFENAKRQLNDLYAEIEKLKIDRQDAAIKNLLPKIQEAYTSVLKHFSKIEFSDVGHGN